VAVKIKLKRLGIADSRTARNGRAIEEIGLYHPKEEPSLIKINSDRVQYWLGVGAQPTEPVLVLLKITGDWQKFKGLPGAEGTLRVAQVKVDKNTKFADTVKAVANEPRTPTIRPKVEKPVLEEKAVEEKVAEESAAPEAEVIAEAVVENTETVVEEVAEEVAQEAAEVVAEVTEEA
jgi:small subunit ribosomal protein S16